LIETPYNTITDAMTAMASATPEPTYEICVTLSYDAKKKTYMSHYFFDINEAYICYQEFMCELGKNFSVIELIETTDEVSVRLLDRVTDDGSVRNDVMKSLESILKELETPASDCEREKELERHRENSEKFAQQSREDREGGEVMRKSLCKITRNMKDTENKRARCKYDSETESDAGSDAGSDTESEHETEVVAEEYNRFHFVNIVYDVRKMPDDIFNLFLEEVMRESANRESFKKVREDRASNVVV
jgi:hypothetical protein